jgi:hypothetical protein
LITYKDATIATEDDVAEAKAINDSTDNLELPF